jgi:hypothetical protein
LRDDEFAAITQALGHSRFIYGEIGWKPSEGSQQASGQYHVEELEIAARHQIPLVAIYCHIADLATPAFDFGLWVSTNNEVSPRPAVNAVAAYLDAITPAPAPEPEPEPEPEPLPSGPVHTFKTDHGGYLRAEEGGGNEGDVIQERPKGLLTGTGPDKTAWQKFSVIPSDAGIVYLLSSGFVDSAGRVHKRFLCNENEGKEGIVVANRPRPGGWEAFKVWTDGDGRVSFEAVCRPGFFIKTLPDGRVILAQPEVWNAAEQKMVADDKPGGYEKFVAEPRLSIGGTGTYQPAVGPTRLDGRIWLRPDGTRYTPHATHFMEMFSLWCRNREVCKAQITAIADISWSYGVRPVYRFLDTLGFYPYWRGREVSPIAFTARDGYHVPATPRYYEQLQEMLAFIKSIGGAVRWSCGDTQMFGSGQQQIDRMLHDCDMNASILDAVGEEVMETWEAGNETTLNGIETPSEARQYLQRFKARHPKVLCGLGAPLGTEESADLIVWAQGADYGAVHGYRPGNESMEEFQTTLRHLFSVRREGYGHNSPTQPIVQGEPFGPGHDVSGGRTNNVEMLTLAAVLSHVTAQAWTYMSGHGVRWNGNIHDQPGFREVLRATAQIPQGIYGWHIYRGGNPENPLAAVPGYYGDAGVSEGPHRVDGATDGHSFWNVVYGGKRRFRVRATRALEGVIWNPATDDRKGFALNSGQEMELDYAVGRVVHGVFR